jgi:hypothetical protein
MSLDDHPTVRAVRARSSQAVHDAPLSSEFIKQIARDCGADDVGSGIRFEKSTAGPARCSRSPAT